MAPLAFLSLGRHAFFPVFKTGLRSLSTTTSFFRPSSPIDFQTLANTAAHGEGAKEAENKWASNSARAISEAVVAPNPYSGRSVRVRSNNLGDSLKQLDNIIARNKVKFQLRMTERHEKKGYKRRRLASERWRNQFANEVRKKVQLVMKMRDRGA